MSFDLSSVQYLNESITRPFAMNSLIGTRRQRRGVRSGGLQEMWDKAPDFALEHYQATAEAINRMRMD